MPVLSAYEKVYVPFSGAVNVQFAVLFFATTKLFSPAVSVVEVVAFCKVNVAFSTVVPSVEAATR